MPVTLLPATEQLALLRRHAISPLELAEEAHRANPAAQSTPKCNRRLRRGARARAGSEGAAGTAVGIANHGQVVNLQLAGYRCEIGSTLNRGSVPAKNAVVVDRLLERGRRDSGNDELSLSF
jgi:Asp-tRNA(Asn)/Glu-tRNA(Gln) amidotransferase A subunit family amidase